MRGKLSLLTHKEYIKSLKSLLEQAFDYSKVTIQEDKVSYALIDKDALFFTIHNIFIFSWQ